MALGVDSLKNSMQVLSVSVEGIFKLINQAQSLESATSSFKQLMDKKARQLHLVIGLHDENPGECLTRFAIEYIEMAPRLIECVQACSHESHYDLLFKPFVDTSLGFFINPQVKALKHQSLETLLVSAYLCHRLMEEMYDNNRTTRNSELCAVESTQANLLAHQLIGEPFANELDQSLEITAKRLAGSPDYYQMDLKPFVNQAQHQSWIWMRNYWQTLLIRNHIEFHFSYRNMF